MEARTCMVTVLSLYFLVEIALKDHDPMDSSDEGPAIESRTNVNEHL